MTDGAIKYAAVAQEIVPLVIRNVRFHRHNRCFSFALFTLNYLYKKINKNLFKDTKKTNTSAWCLGKLTDFPFVVLFLAVKKLRVHEGLPPPSPFHKFNFFRCFINQQACLLAFLFSYINKNKNLVINLLV